MYISQFDIPTLHVPTVPTKDWPGHVGFQVGLVLRAISPLATKVFIIATPLQTL